ncbi:MAG: quinol dehydrogenase ferredoxin subunit NapH [Hyphomicrobiales bacterium]|nr:quinol dehydrogenase ferredoxin subunit NapH [Hyphomicrobiales bacterium]
MKPGQRPGQEAIAAKGRFAAFKWLILRRAVQAAVLGLFLLGPLAGLWLVKGNLASSLTLDILPLTDPYVLVQTLVTGHLPETAAVLGAVIVALFYVLVGGRAYCAWVCPVNPVTDAAHWLRDRLGLKGGMQFRRGTRYWVLAMTLVVAALTGTVAWELANPVSMVFRGLVFGMGFAWAVLAAVFLFDLFVSRRGWCGHLCPVGAFYGLLGAVSLLRVSARRRADCNDCMDCYAVCPEPQVINPALKGADQGASPVILSAQCTNCGRCIDVCSKDVFTFAARPDRREDSKTGAARDSSLRDAA